jgi:hypothetical protein
MEDHEMRRKIIRQWISLPKDKRQTAEQAAAFAKKAVEENELQRSRRDPYQRVMGWLAVTHGCSQWGQLSDCEGGNFCATAPSTLNWGMSGEP